jgi:hypothetical protein
MFDITNFILFTLLSTLLVEFFHFIISVIFKHRQLIYSETDQAIADDIMKYLAKTHWYSTSYLRTTRCNWPTGIVFGRDDKNNYWLSYIESSSSDNNHSRNHDFNIKLYSTKEISISKKFEDTDSEEDTHSSVASISKQARSSLKTLVCYRKYNSWKNSNYRRMELGIRPDLVSTNQKSIIDDIVEMVETSYANGFSYGGFFMISGGTGSGKSALGRFLAEKIGANFCDDFRLSEPGYNLYQLLHIAEPSREEPLVLVLEEFDRDLEIAHQGTAEQHKWLTSTIYDKASWNTFADRLMDYQNLIVIATTNRTRKWFDDLDTSYLRTGRLNKWFDLDSSETSHIATTSHRLRFTKQNPSAENNSKKDD